MKKRVRIKYCGGCNPDYDRVSLVKQITACYSGTIEWVSGGSDPCDAVVAIHGCRTACTDLSTFDGCRILQITCPQEAGNILAEFPIPHL